VADLSNEPNSINLVIVQGSDLSFSVTITDPTTDFTGATARAKIVKDFASMTLVIALTCVVNTASNGLLTATVSLTNAQTAGLTDTSAGQRTVNLGQWDFEVVLGSKVTRYMQGAATLSREATT